MADLEERMAKQVRDKNAALARVAELEAALQAAEARGSEFAQAIKDLESKDVQVWLACVLCGACAT